MPRPSTIPTFSLVNSHVAVALFGGQRALLLQLAHPLVAAAVRDHSRFASDPFGRLLRTLDFMRVLLFGTDQEQQEVLRWFHAVHASIQGRLGEELSPFSEQASYAGTDSSLLLWVWATLVETAPTVFQRTVTALNPAQKGVFYRASKEWGLRLGVAEEQIPATWREFQRYFQRTLTSLPISETAKQLAVHILYPKDIPQLVSQFFVALTTEMLPLTLRHGYRLDYTPTQKALAHTTLAVMPGLWPFMPKEMQSVDALRWLLTQSRKVMQQIKNIYS